MTSLGLVLAYPDDLGSLRRVASLSPIWRQCRSPSEPKSNVIVLLKDDASGLAPRSTARMSAVGAEESPIVDQLQTGGAKVESTGSEIPYVDASVTSAQKSALASDPDVQAVVPNVVIPNPFPWSPSDNGPSSSVGLSYRSAARRSAAPPRGHPQVNPEAITSSAINSVGANALGYDGAGVTVAYIAGEIDPSDR